MRLVNIWGVLRDVIRNSFSFAQIKDICGKSGLPVYELAHVQQKFKGGASKGQLMDEIDKLYVKLSESEKEQVVKNCIKELATRGTVNEELEKTLENFGWGLSDNEPYPLDLKIDIDTIELSSQLQKGIKKCVKRYRDGDLSGAMSAICGLVDNLTEEIFIDKKLGEHKKESYQDRINKAFNSFEVIYKENLEKIGVDNEEINRLWNNHRKSINEAGYVLGSYRRIFSDVHGEGQEPNNVLVQRALDVAVYIIRNLISIRHEGY